MANNEYQVWLLMKFQKIFILLSLSLLMPKNLNYYNTNDENFADITVNDLTFSASCIEHVVHFDCSTGILVNRIVVSPTSGQVNLFI